MNLNCRQILKLSFIAVVSFGAFGLSLTSSLGFAFFPQTYAAAAGPAESKMKKSKRIKETVAACAPLALSGIREYKVKPTSDVKAALKELALQIEYVASEEEWNWAGSEDSAWEADSTNWGLSNMKDAYSYITDLDSGRKEELEFPENTELKRAVALQIQAAKFAFKGFLNTGVQFGVVPLGSVQCGVTFAALAIIDPHTGKIYVFAKEGSGC